MKDVKQGTCSHKNMKEKKQNQKIKITKGLKRVTYLPPYPPQKLTATNTNSGMVKITWARPKGEFEKYILKVTFFLYHYGIIIIISCLLHFSQGGFVGGAQTKHDEEQSLTDEASGLLQGWKTNKIIKQTNSQNK